ncbi:hypothetical protein ACEPAH_8506 [Sanghuangporus vaninii]
MARRAVAFKIEKHPPVVQDHHVCPHSIANGAMSSKDTDEIVIKKRRRRTAVDLCLGYYGHDEDGLFESSLQVEPPSAKDENDPEQDIARRKQKQQKVETSSDSAQTLTSPLSENTNVITVEDFLRQQVTEGTRTSRKIYSRKRQRRILFSSDASDGDDENQHVVGSSPKIFLSPAQLHPRSRQSVKSGSIKDLPASRNKVPSRVETTCSGRIQRAAILSSVDTAVDTPAPLRLVSRDQLSPISPPRDKRAKLIDPRLPRHLDTSFATKEDYTTRTRSKTKTCRPFLQWDCPTRNLNSNESSPAPLLTETAREATSCRQSHLTIAPLKLVPYEKHSEALAARFDQKSLRNGRRAIAALILQENVQLRALEESTVRVDHDLPTSLPLSRSSQSKAYCQSNVYPDQQSKNIDICQDTEPILVPETSQPTVSPNSNALARFTDSVDNNDALQARSKIASDPLNICALDPNDSSHNLARSSPPIVLSQKPMHRLGTMLSGLRERARSVLLSQSQMQVQERLVPGDSCPSELPRTKSRRLSSRRVVVSSPAQILTPVSNSSVRHAAEKDGTASANDLMGKSISRNNARPRKGISMSSVSTFLRRNTVAGEPEEASSDSDHSIRQLGYYFTFSNGPVSRTTDFESAWTDFTIDGEQSSEAISTMPDSNFFSNYASGSAVPNLFDLLEESEPGGGHISGTGAQIILSPSI